MSPQAWTGSEAVNRAQVFVRLVQHCGTGGRPCDALQAVDKRSRSRGRCAMKASQHWQAGNMGHACQIKCLHGDVLSRLVALLRFQCLEGAIIDSGCWLPRRPQEQCSRCILY